MFIEKAFGVLKRRFPLLKHGLRMRKGEHNCMMMLSAFVLHNMCIYYKNGEFEQLSGNCEGDSENESENALEMFQSELGMSKRDDIAQRFFT